MTATADSAADEPTVVDELHDAEEYEADVREIATEEYVEVDDDATVGDAIRQFRSETPSKRDEPTVYYAYVTDDDGRLVGVASLRALLASDDSDPVSTVMEADVVAFDVDSDAEEAAAQAADLGFLAVPVVEAGRLVGIVRVDDLLALVEEQATEDMMRLAGMDLSDVEAERSTLMLDASILDILRIRVPWLIVALAGGFLAGGVIGVYEAALEAVLILAFFIPVIMDMGGNVGTQSSTIFVRGVVLGHIDRSNVIGRIVKETIVGALIGLAVGSVAALVAYLWIGEVDLAMVVLGSMVGTSVVAALVGFVVPWIMHVVGQDPAAASNPIITTIKDVSGLVIYFSLALLLMDIAI